MRKPLLLIPGPMQVPDFVTAGGNRPLFNFRSVEMADLRAKLEAACKPLFGTTGDILFLLCSGTGGMESAVMNLTSPGEEVIVVVSGVFSQRWEDIGRAHGLVVHTVQADWRRGASVAEIQQALTQWPQAEVVFHTSTESSTGVANDTNGIGKLIRDQGKIFAVDAIAELGISPLNMDERFIDVVVGASQKGLMSAPGVAVIAVGARAWERSEAKGFRRFYFDWQRYRHNIPFTPALSVLLQLEAALGYIHHEGLSVIYQRRSEVAQRIRDVVLQRGMEVYALRPSNGVTTVLPPSGVDIAQLCRRLASDFGIHVAVGMGRLADSTFRIGHVGYLGDDDLDYFAKSFDRCTSSGQ